MGNEIISTGDQIKRYSNKDCQILNNFFKLLEKQYGATYLFYMSENKKTNEKTIYSSNWKWQNILIGEKLINDCAIFKSAYNAIEVNKLPCFILPWNMANFSTSREKDVLLYRSEFNIANGIGVAFASNNTRETVGIGGEVSHINFYKKIRDDDILKKVLFFMRSYFSQPWGRQRRLSIYTRIKPAIRFSYPEAPQSYCSQYQFLNNFPFGPKTNL